LSGFAGIGGFASLVLGGFAAGREAGAVLWVSLSRAMSIALDPSEV
jgi:hypothetical protein